MPLYEYLCAKCGKRFEKIEKLSAPHKQKCPHCGGRAERQLSSPAIQFKGSGWYVTDYARKSAPPETKGSEGGSESKDVKEGKEAKDVKEKKPAAKDSKKT